MGTLVSYEMGKSLQEGKGEVQEMIDICDFAVGQSRQLYGNTMVSEREQHRMYDQYHPLGVVGTISAFNFPVAVWSWNAMLATVCGNTNLWKPSSQAPLCTIAVQNILSQVIKDNNLPEGLFSLIVGRGSSVDESNHVGPLIDSDAVEDFLNALEKVRQEGGKVIYGGSVLEGEGFESICYVVPAVAEVENSYKIVQEETFAPILYLIKYSGEVENGLLLHNDVVQGLSSAIFTENICEAELFLSAAGSDCGLANVNTGTSGAEIGGAFGGEKETGGGRESGSDAWKAYMRRQTNTINYGKTLPLAQGIKFDI